MDPFYGWGSTASRLELLRGSSLLFITKFPEIPGTHFINFGRMRGWVDLVAVQWYWTQDPWIGALTARPLLLTCASGCFWKCIHETRKKIVGKEFLYLYKRNKWKCLFFYFLKETSENACVYFMVGFLWGLYSDTIFLWCGEK